ncbi:MAG: transglutaminase family protein [Solirubrobacteraceae bacterium]|jgi:transglutaminase-like putative cysteine protease
MPARYEVTHRTAYRYASDVTDSYAQLHLLPRDLPGQRCHTSEVIIDPVPEDYRERLDYFGNRVSHLAIHSPHRALTVTAKSLVEVDDRPGESALHAGRPWEHARDAISAGRALDPLDAVQYVLDSPLVGASPAFADYAAETFTPERPLLEAVSELCHRIHADFRYESGSTSVSTPLAEVFAQRRGVCQDFAHLGIACLRSLGLAGRYVSGYLETDPPPGRPKLMGADGSHAWLSALIPWAGWLDIDPTNDQLASSRYIVTAYGRDYSDVPPLNGVIYTRGATESLRVSVDVVALPGAPSGA